MQKSTIYRQAFSNGLHCVDLTHIGKIDHQNISLTLDIADHPEGLEHKWLKTSPHLEHKRSNAYIHWIILLGRPQLSNWSIVPKVAL